MDKEKEPFRPAAAFLSIAKNCLKANHQLGIGDVEDAIQCGLPVDQQPEDFCPRRWFQQFLARLELRDDFVTYRGKGLRVPAANELEEIVTKFHVVSDDVNLDPF